MPTFQGSAFANFYKRILQIGNSDNSGTPTSTTAIQPGDGVATSMSVSDDVLKVQPQTDNTTGAFLVNSQAGNNILAVDTTNSLVKVGAGQVSATTQYAYFNVNHSTVDALGSPWDADKWYGVPFGASTNAAVQSNYFGASTTSSFNDTDPATSLTIGTNAHTALNMYWYVPDNITIDAVHWFHGADAATGDTTAAHLMAYDIDTGNGSTSGDLSSGVVLADGSNITNAGYEQIYYQSMTIQSADVDAGKIIIFCFASDTVNSDYTIQATVKYHIR